MLRRSDGDDRPARYGPGTQARGISDPAINDTVTPCVP
jgi:hypothetical protein